VIAVARVFISYAREDKPVIQSLAEGLTHAGHEVWWDADLGAADAFRETIESQIAGADVVVVVWSQRAKASRYVVDEAERAVGRGVLLPLRLDGSPPLGFGTFNALDFSGWGGDYNCDAWRRLLSEIARIAAAPVPPPARLPLRVLPHALAVAGAWGVLLGLATWGLYSLGNPRVTASALGHPLVDSIALGVVAAAPVALWSAIETKRAGFEKLSLIARRSLVWFACGGSIALVIIALAAAAGVLDPSSPRGIAGELSRAFVIVSAASAFAVTTVKLGWLLARRVLGMRPG
jgi:hypothetical protein